MPRWRKYFRFKLRSLMAIITIFSILLAWSAYEIQWYSREAEAIAALQATGAELHTNVKGPAFLRLFVGNRRFQTANDFRCSGETAGAFTDEHVKLVARLRSLQSITIDRVEITDEQLCQFSLSRHVELRHLALRNTAVTGEGLRGLSGHPRLLRVDFSHSPIGDVAMAYLAECPRLCNIDLSGSSITDKGLATLRHLPLQHIDVSYTAVTDEGVRRFLESSSSRLKSIRAAYTFVTPDAIEGFRKNYPSVGLPDLGFPGSGISGCCAPNDKHRIAQGILVGHGVNVSENNDEGGWRVHLADEWSRLYRKNDLSLLSALSNLTLISFHGGDIDDRVIKDLMAISDLNNLSLYGTTIGDAGLYHLSSLGLTKLSVLLLANTKITDNGLQYLEAFPNLKNLNLAATQLTNEGLKYVADVPLLEKLVLTNTRIDDDGLKHLRVLQSLKMIDLAGTNVQLSGIQDLKAAIPGLLAIQE